MGRFNHTSIIHIFLGGIRKATLSKCLNTSSVEGCTTEHYRRSEEEYKRTTFCLHQHLFQSVNGVIAADVIDRHLHKLTQIDATFLATNLYSKKLLSKPNLKKILNSQRPDNDLAQGLLESSEIIKSNGRKFNDFLLILADESVHEELMESLKNEYGESKYIMEVVSLVYPIMKLEGLWDKL